MIHAKELEKLIVRSVFVIAPDKIITHPASNGRDLDEVLRVVDSLPLTQNQKVAIPVNWRNGHDCIIVPSLSVQDASKLFFQGVEKIKP